MHDHPQVLANLISGYLDTGRAADAQPSHANTARIAPRSTGKTLFRIRCAACHSIGGGDGLGPDLAAVVAKRPHAWLVRWLRYTDRMRAEKEPVATALFNRYRQLAMPNLRLSTRDPNIAHPLS